jgi:2-iminoacetate synthase
MTPDAWVYDFFDEPLLIALDSLRKLKFTPRTNGYIEKSNYIKSNIFNNEIYPIVPLYLTNYCNQTCLYCNYSRFNMEIKRQRLSCEELYKEIEYLVTVKGYKTIELVYATDPHISAADIVEHIKMTKKFLLQQNGKYVGINAKSFSLDEYKIFKNAGLDFVILWQETYDENRYMDLHPNQREKSNYIYRLDTYEKIFEAGIKNIGMGVLTGIQRNWIKDWMMLIIHEAYLKWKYNRSASILGIPRLKGIAEIKYLPQIEYLLPSDTQFLELVAIHNIYSPMTFSFVSTRENWNYCLKLASGGGCLFTFDCSTYPGGYTHNEENHQFPTHNLEIEKYFDKALNNNFHPKFDWTFPE